MSVGTMARSAVGGGGGDRRTGFRPVSTGAFAGAVVLLLALGGCVTAPTAPAVMTLPGQYKPLDQFQFDDLDCRNYANATISGQVKAANDAAAANALGTALLGAAAGAAFGSWSGQAGEGAAIGAGVGALLAGAASANQGNAVAYDLQRRFDAAYLQCMYARGNQVPAPAGAPPVTRYPAPPASSAPAQYPPPASMTPPAASSPPGQYVPPPPGQYVPPGQYTPPVQYPPPVSVPRQQ